MPDKDFIAELAAAILEELIKSIVASACRRSILLFKNALSVNSPALACLAYFAHMILSIFPRIIGFPCV